MTTGVSIEAMTALKDVRNVSREYGTPIIVNLRGEDDVRRDSLGTIKARVPPAASLATYALPVEYGPSERHLEQAGIREKVECLIKTPILDWVEAGIIDLARMGITFMAIDITRSTVTLDGLQWKVADKGIPERVGEVPHHVSLGLRRN